MKYLITDDSKLARFSLIKALKSHDAEAEIFQAENGQIALDIMQKEMIDIVFLDLTMPVLDGYEALPKLLELNNKAKVIVISADIQTKAKEKVLMLGAKLHVQKPINADKMQKLLKLL